MVLIALMAFVVSGCGGGSSSTPVEPTPSVKNVQLTFTDGTTAKKVPVGVSGGIIAIAIYSDNTSKNITEEVIPVSDNDNVVGIADNRLIALSEGSAQVTVTYQGVSSNKITVNVANASVVLDRIQVSPAGLSLPINASAIYSAIGIYSDGTVMDITKDVSWSSSNTDVATIVDGEAKAIGTGTTTISAAKGNVSGTTGLTVSLANVTSLHLTLANGTTAIKVPVGATGNLVATALLSDGTTVDVTTQVSYDTNAPKVIDIQKDGTIKALAEGSAQITVTFNGTTSNTVTVNVASTNVVLSSIVVNSDKPEIVVGTSTILTAIGTYSDGTVVDITEDVSWSSGDTNIITIVENEAIGVGVGTVTVSAVLNGKEGELGIKVNQAQITALKIVKDDNSLNTTGEFVVGETIKVRALADFDNGMTNVDVTDKVIWQSMTPETVSVNGHGLITALSTGHAEVVAYYQGEFGEASDKITGEVVEKIIEKIQIFTTPENAVVAAGESIELQAWAIYNDGTNANISDTVKWTSYDKRVVVVYDKEKKSIFATANERVETTIEAFRNETLKDTQIVVFERGVFDHIEIQEGYCENGDCPVITGKTVDIPIVDRIDYENKPEGVYYPTAWAVYTDGSKTYINSMIGIRWWSADQVRAYVDTTKGSFVFGRGVGEGIEISVSYRGEYKTSFYVNVIEDTTSKTLKEIGIINTKEQGWGCSQYDEDYGKKLNMDIGEEGKYLQACGKFQYTDGSIQWEDINNNVAWFSSDSNIARVSTYTGEIKALGGGNAVVTAQLAEIKGSIDIFVNDKIPDHIEIQEGYDPNGQAPIITGKTVDIPIVDDVSYDPVSEGAYYPTAWLVFTDGSKEYINTTSGIRWWSADQVRAYVDTTRGSFVFGRGVGKGIEISVSYRGEYKTSFYVNVLEDTKTKTLIQIGIKNTKDLGWGCTQEDVDYGTGLTLKVGDDGKYLMACGKFQYSDGSMKWEDINNNVAWFSSKENVARVRTTTGELVAKSEGNTLISAQLAKIEGNINVTVVEK